MLWIEDIVESTLVPPFLTNSKNNMIGFVNLHKVVARKSAFSIFPSAQNGGEIGRLNKKWKVETTIFTNGKGF
jgi:hypothetical protein